MFREEFKKIKCSKEKIMDFGAVLSLAFSVFALLLYFKGAEWFWYLLAAAILLNGVLIARPMALKIIYQYWMKLSVIIGYFVTKILLGILFFACIFPIALIKKRGIKKQWNLNLTKN